MFIVGKDVKGLNKVLEQAIAQDYDSMVFPTDELLKEKENLAFFRSETEAENFCFIHGSLGKHLAVEEIKTILGQTTAIDRNPPAQGVDFYFFAADEVFTNRGKLSAGEITASRFPMSVTMLEDVVQHPFKEWLNDHLAVRLVDRLQTLGEAAVQVERSIVPAHHIDSYFFMKRSYQKTGEEPEEFQMLENIGEFKDYAIAKDSFLKLVASPADSHSDVLLIGQYQDKGLRFDVEGNVYASTGYCAAVAYPASNSEDTLVYKAYLFDDPRLATTIKESFRLTIDGPSDRIALTDVFGNERQLDRFFWNEQLTPAENLESLVKQLEHLQFPDAKSALENNYLQEEKALVLTTKRAFQENMMQYDLHYLHQPSGLLYLAKFTAVLQKSIDIGVESVHGIDIKNLEGRMRQIDWKKDDADLSLDEVLHKKEIRSDLQELDPKTRTLLKAKYWNNSQENLSADEIQISGLLHRLNRYHHTVHCKNTFDTINASQSYQVLCEYAKQMEKFLDVTNSLQHHSNLKHTTMNKDNLEYLKNSLKYSGFGEELHAKLEEKMASNVPEFTLAFNKEMNNRKLDAVLHFKKGNEGEMYFFNKYDATMTKVSGQELQQTFYMDKGRSFTAKEAFNLLDGRAVFKDLVNQEQQAYSAWVKLDFTKQKDNGNYEMNRYTENYGYNLATALEKLAPKELLDAARREDLFKSLERGNLHAVTVESGEKIWIAANPESGKNQKLLKYDEKGKEITVEVKNFSVNAAKDDQQNKTNNKAQKNDLSHNEETGEKTSKKKQRSAKQPTEGDPGLLTKKRQATPGKSQKV